MGIEYSKLDELTALTKDNILSFKEECLKTDLTSEEVDLLYLKVLGFACNLPIPETQENAAPVRSILQYIHEINNDKSDSSFLIGALIQCAIISVDQPDITKASCYIAPEQLANYQSMKKTLSILKARKKSGQEPADD